MTQAFQPRLDEYRRDLTDYLDGLEQEEAGKALDCLVRVLAMLQASPRGLEDMLARFHATAASASALAEQAGHELRVCWHEAGHAVACVVLGIPFLDVSVLQAGGIVKSDGHVSLDWANYTRPIRGAHTAKEKQDVLDHIVMNQAGPIAEGWALPQEVSKENWETHNEQSRKWAARLRPPMDFACTEALLYFCNERARGLILSHFPAVEILASVLNKRGKLTGEEATAIAKAAIAGDPIPGGIDE